MGYSLVIAPVITFFMHVVVPVLMVGALIWVMVPGVMMCVVSRLAVVSFPVVCHNVCGCRWCVFPLLSVMSCSVIVFVCMFCLCMGLSCMGAYVCTSVGVICCRVSSNSPNRYSVFFASVSSILVVTFFPCPYSLVSW